MDQQKQPSGYDSRRPEFLRPSPPLWLVLSVALGAGSIAVSIIALVVRGGAA